ncbi:SDR family oxidoreductase [Sediminibacterium ginsengisoli]|uniref:Short-chain dehydrogenase n=1 Tax=Sediminibacterium ginsengisoli TaxID=413434 RepID=A0A1T4QC19_9BACT|nr:SDR family oxidoreductase [Sediminibacterium ginsengisoli]SKA01312.1 Short-chain dehydrogenase [Sediminibacterium ginsengisoli]
MSDFKNKVVVITGGSEGIGKALVDIFLQHGAKVATCSRNYDKLYQLQKTYPGQPLFIHTADVSKEQDCQIFIDAVVKNFGTIDILINNAGVSMRALVQDAELDTIRKVMDINFWGTVYCTKFALPYIQQNKGTIAGVSSIAGFRGLPGRSGYSASKYAVTGFLEALRTELLNSGVNVMWVCPGFTASNIRNAALNKDGQAQGESPLDEKKLMSAEECASYILKAIAKRKRTLVLTMQGKQTVYLNRFFPSLADKLVRNFFFKNDALVK